MFYNISLILFLIFFWITNSSIFNLFFFIVAIISITCTYFIYYFVTHIVERELDVDLHVYRKLPSTFIIVKSMFYFFYSIVFYSIKLLCMIIVNKKVESSIVKINLQDIKCNFQLMIATHSITMTPGSISIFQDKSIIFVHCFDRYHLDDIKKANSKCDLL